MHARAIVPVVLLAALAALGGCASDTFYSFQGSVTALRLHHDAARPITDALVPVPLEGVEASLHLEGNPAPFTSVRSSGLPGTGFYRMGFLFPGGASPHHFLPFRKSGYQTRQVYPFRPVADPMVVLEPLPMP
jgi:hypothetical protein